MMCCQARPGAHVQQEHLPAAAIAASNHPKNCQGNLCKLLHGIHTNLNGHQRLVQPGMLHGWI